LGNTGNQVFLIFMNEDPKHNPSYIPQIGIPEKEKFQERVSTRAIYHKATSPGFFGLIVIFFFLPFINIKCNGTLMKKYSGIDIIQGDENNADQKNGHLVTGIRQSAFHQFEMARENFRWKQKLEENYEQYIDDAPYFEENIPGDDFFHMPESLNETSRNPTMMRLVTLIALLCAVLGLICSFWKQIIGNYVQIFAAVTGFLCIFFLQFYVKITVPSMTNEGATMLENEYSAPVITTEFALGYWMVLFLFLGVSIVSILKLRWLKKWKAANG
jgi:hypothetical protein